MDKVFGLGLLLGLFCGFIAGGFYQKFIWSNVFKKFNNEMHEQYLSIIKKQGIRVKT